VERLCASNVLAKEMAGWRPEIALKEGLEKTIAWIRANEPHDQPAAYAI